MSKVQENKHLKRVTLEMSLKPFRSMEPQAVEAVCEEAIRQWLPLIGLSDTASVLLWVSDGSEILVWDGDLDREMEWARYIGFANEWLFSQITEGKDDPKTAILYTEEPVQMTYRHLQTIIATMKEVGRTRFGLQLEVGATFDAGPEFAYSDFKYKDHPEINMAELGGAYVTLKAAYTVVCTWSKLKADQVRYAAYPEGIPEGTPFGEFLGRQCASFLPALGFDYIWFSNGFALSYFPWTYLGANYNGTELSLADHHELSAKVLSFWDAFKAACPGYRTEVRGTNFGTGMDLAKDHIPLRELYKREYLTYPPPNSPWGALNFDFGLEMAGYMSRIAVLPGEDYPYRYYPNDPWFWQNPWTDLYDREPHDIYCPLSAARIGDDGALQPPRLVELLTIDTERGELPEDTALEVSMHLRRALKSFPDEPGLLTWVYPFDELHDAAAAGAANDRSIFFHDWFVRNAINEGLPLNTVVSSQIFGELTEQGSAVFGDTILVTSTFWLQEEAGERLMRHVRQGGKALLYGALRDDALMAFLNMRQAEGVSGEAELEMRLAGDEVNGAAMHRMKLNVAATISDGELQEVCADPQDPHTRVRATVVQGETERVFALSRSLPEWQGGRIAWVRGALPYESAGITNLPQRQDFTYGDSAALARYLLQDFGYTLLQTRQRPETPAALFFVGRRDNGFTFTGCKQDTSVQLSFGFPDGVPLLIGQTTEVGGDTAAYALDRTFRDECRIFVKQEAKTMVRCREMSGVPTPKKRFLHNLPSRKLVVQQLEEATVTLYPPLDALEQGLVEVKAGEVYLDLSDAIHGRKIVLEKMSGVLEITW
ncbi:hypothetical protein [Paenibacillus sp. 1P07SE]|uniref:hypothetical protein n=1 Tax=Paenibacillus sp. 1P07SE TaxID=3132209 RepID=UPI0039A4E3A1